MSYLEGAEKFYDLFGEKEDVDFYVGQAKKYGGKALELGVGTARLAIRLVEAGVEVWGIDSSQHMLRAAKEKTSTLEPETRNRLHLKLADVVDFKLPERFNLIYFPSSSFDHIIDPNDQRRALKSIREHVSTGGAYIFDLYILPERRDDEGWFVQRKELDDTRYVVRTGYHATKADSNLMSMNLWYEVYYRGRMLERYHEGSNVYLHSAEGIRKKLSEAGFMIIKEYGNYRYKPYEPGDGLMVIIARPV